MTAGHVFIATSLDGFIARGNGDISWLETFHCEGENHGYEDFMADIDGIVMGRRTYETVLGFATWPYRKPVMVLSRTLTPNSVPERLAASVTITADTPQDIMEHAQRQGWKRVYIDGGQVIQSFLAASCIHEIIITRIPILLGTGRPLFGPLAHDLRLDHVQTRAFPSGFVQSTYRCQGPG